MHPLPQAFGSPVPAHSVLADGSFGSSINSATLLCSKVCDWNSHPGSVASASRVIHTPPFALASQSRQSPATQLGSMAAAIERPLKLSVPEL